MRDVSELGQTSAGVWTRSQALHAMSVGRYDAAARGRAWQTLWPGVHAHAGHEPDAIQRAFAAVLASGGGDQDRPQDDGADRESPPRLLRAYACGRTAARCWGFPLVDDDDPATGGQDHLQDDVGVFLHLPDLTRDGRTLHRRQLRLRRGDVVRLPSGLWATSAARTLADCGRLLQPDALVCCLDDALRRGLVTMPGLERQLAATKGARHAPVLREAVARADGRAEAPSETLLRLLLTPHLPALVPQVELFDERVELVARFDLADEVVRFAAEADGKAGHAGAAMVARDRWRDARSRALGWETERFTWFDIRQRRARTVQRALSAAAAQRRRWAA